MTAAALRGRTLPRWLLLRRASQAGVLLLFLAGPWLGVWVVKGNLSASRTLDVLPLTDPLVFLQSVAAGARPLATLALGAAIVALFWLVVGGRAFCAWVCPVNLATDAAAALRRRFRMRPARALPPATRYWLLAFVLVASFVVGAPAWEFVNPVSMTHRAAIFGGAVAWSALAAVFLLDLFVAERGFCGHLCPQGALYALIGAASLLRVSAARRARCDDCGDCFVACPEPAVIAPALKSRAPDASPVIAAGACSNCARCIDVCPRDVFRFAVRFDRRSEP